MHPWISEYYIDPILYDAGYNPVNTITWALILGLMLLFIAWTFRRLEIPLDESLVWHTVPYILAGSSLRVIEDAEIVALPFKYLLITPLIYFVVAVATVTSLLSCKYLLGKRFLKGYALIGLIWTFANLVVLSSVGISHLWALGTVTFLGVATTSALWIFRNVLKLRFLDRSDNFLILFAHMLDASSTYIGVDWLGYYEKHVIPSYLIDLTGTALVMYPLKIAILIPALSLIDSALKDEPNLRNLTKLALLTLGLAPAMRNTIRLTFGI